MTACFSVVALAAAVAFERGDATGGPLTGRPVLNAPFCADATTTVRQSLPDGTTVERRGIARYYRDRAGRVRVEQNILGVEGSLDAATKPPIRTTVFPNPVEEPVVYTLDPVDRTARLGPRFAAGLAIGGGETFAVPLGGPRFLVFHTAQHNPHDLDISASATDDSLGTRLIHGVEAVGRRLTITIPGNDGPLHVVDERWESPELKMVIYARSADPRTGIVEYRLSNIRRADPPSDLFEIPPDYTITRDPSLTWITLEYADSHLRKSGLSRTLPR